MPVRLAAVVEPRDGLLPDVAALREGHRALVQSGLLRDHGVVQVDSVAGAASLDAKGLDRVLRYLLAYLNYAISQSLCTRGVAQQVDSDVGPNRLDRHVSHLQRYVGMLRRWQLGRARHDICLGPDQRQQSALERALVQLHVKADAEPSDHVEQLLQRGAFGVEQQLRPAVEDPQIAEHLALRSQKGRVTP